ncbi:iron ABC transporter permease [Treponema parvum]|uniref:Iron ABC transporter permease n=1 Tax=Treponema parvum TaxID=138851 RepID=A0A975F1K6_9SPIR|nr:iron ABC transporter permease [Treponema parvum]QTQ12610.1 iron ABC transporter permease [Treponema parvum]
MANTKNIGTVKHKKMEIWTLLSIGILCVFGLYLVYPLYGLLKESIRNPQGGYTFSYFTKFFSTPYYMITIWHSFHSSIVIAFVSLLIGIPLSYFYSFYKLKGAKVLFVTSILCCMSAPFLGAYAWVMLLGRGGVITSFLRNIGIDIGSIYGFKGIVLAQSLKLFPLVFIYMNGAFKNIDNSLLEASANMGCTGFSRFRKIVIALSMPTVLAAALIVFMRAFADFGTPQIIGEGYETMPVLIYDQYLGENGQDYNFAAAMSIIAIGVTALVFFVQKWTTNKFRFSINALHSVDKKDPKGIAGFFMYLYSYIIIFLAVLPQAFIIYLSFRNSKGSVFLPGFSMGNYQQAVKRLLVRSIQNTTILGVGSLAIIILLAIIIAYLVVRRGNFINNTIDTISMMPYIMPGSVIGIAMLLAFGKKPFALTGTLAIMIISLVVRRMPYTIRSATANLMQIPMSIEDAAISLGASKMKTFFKVTVPMMSNGILAGAILSWVSIVTEVSSAIILYNNKTITLTMSSYVAIERGNYGLASAFAAILTVITGISLMFYLAISKSEDVNL